MHQLYKFFIAILIITTLSASSANARYISGHDVQTILYRENIDLDAKSLKGWMRVFNSDSKLNDYEIYVTEEEKELILIYLNKLFDLENKKYAKVVR